ncbi:hypothetical protein SteCoe_31749 [Stentor coeruleus]|uniref:Uncharacterized protein n=1 Tax=Stentor coeruleus TaxID=5963 RepID=A0A1R2B0M0_9CILI|nr:hypothetical protein SteCoe_31749 [Stentor coeruleus]
MKFLEKNPFDEGELDEYRHVFGYESRDPEGIPWNSIYFQSSREEFRERRSLSYNSFRNQNDELELDETFSGIYNNYFSFIENHLIKAEFSHFQLRNNVQCIAYDQIYMKTRPNCLTRYNPVTYEQKIIIKPDFTAVSFNVLDENMIVGGTEGELMLCDTDGKIKFNIVLTEEDSRITNSCTLVSELGEVFIMACNNDRKVRFMHPETRAIKEQFEFSDCVNSAVLSTDKRKIGACLDSTEDFVIDRVSGDTIGNTSGHTDFGFSCAWDPSFEYYFATSNQDHSVIIWDIRTGPIFKPIHVLKGQLGAALCVKYSKNGKYLAFIESADYLNIIDKKDYSQRQVLDYFGETSGFDFCEDYDDTNSIFLGIADPKYNSLIEHRENKKDSNFIY